MKEKAKSLMWLYQRFFFRVNIAYTEAKNPLVLTSVVLPALTLLAVYGLQYSWLQIIIANLVLLLIAFAAGEILLRIGVVAYRQKLSNQQSPELMEIHAAVSRIERFLGVPEMSGPTQSLAGACDEAHQSWIGKIKVGCCITGSCSSRFQRLETGFTIAVPHPYKSREDLPVFENDCYCDCRCHPREPISV